MIAGLACTLQAEGRLAVTSLPTLCENPWTNSGRAKAPVRELSSSALRRAPFRGYVSDSSYLVDPASSHMLVSKIKPCMSKYKQICTVKLRMAH